MGWLYLYTIDTRIKGAISHATNTFDNTCYNHYQWFRWYKWNI